MNTATIGTGSISRDIVSITIGALQSGRKGEIILVYMNDGEADSLVLRYDQLSRREKYLIRTIAQDPLSVLERVKPHVTAHQAA